MNPRNNKSPVKQYDKLSSQGSLHGLTAGSDDDDEIYDLYEADGNDLVQIDLSTSNHPFNNRHVESAVDFNVVLNETIGQKISKAINYLTFDFVVPLLQLGNTRPLMQSDLYPLEKVDSSLGVYKTFKASWKKHLKTKKSGEDDSSISLAMTYISAFGLPFFAAGLLKLIYDSLMFLNPLILGKIVHFLNSKEPLSHGLLYVLILFLANVVMSLCLRRYFYSCFRVGLRLRTAVITSVYAKALVLSSSELMKRSVGEVTNLMSVDSARLQDLTPYLHAIWYSFFQIGVAIYFLWQQMGPACMGGVFVILITIPMTGKISSFLKKTQTELSRIRDERIKLTNEILAGMKVLKLQAWEEEMRNRINAVRDLELTVFLRYVFMQSLSGAIYTTIPIIVSIATFAWYVASGHDLDVGTALTSLALFDLLRFPLFMLPNVINNLVEAKVSVDRIQRFLLAKEKQPVPEGPLQISGAIVRKGTFVWKTGNSSRSKEKTSLLIPSFSEMITNLKSFIMTLYQYVSGATQQSNTPQEQTIGSNTTIAIDFDDLTDDQLMNTILRTQLDSAETMIETLLNEKHGGFSSIEDVSSSNVDDLRTVSDNNFLDRTQSVDIGMNPLHMTTVSSDPTTVTKGEPLRLLTLNRISLQASSGMLLAVVGQTGSGKSSILSALLGEIRCVYGTVFVKGRIAYVGQQAFIQNGSLRDNIIFGREFNDEKYASTIRDCCLEHDLKVLPSGDNTEIGERGINLSGGQKARVALARAVYNNADVYLLDDTLSAVDAHVGQLLFENCITKLRHSGKCVILVTNALHFLKSVDKILVLKNGSVAEIGTYDSLFALKGPFFDMITAYHTSTEETTSTSVGRGDVNGGGCNALTDKVNKEESNRPTQAPLSLPAGNKLITDEEREVGDVDGKVYRKWFEASGGITVALLMVVLNYFAEFVTVLSSWWLSYWSENTEGYTAKYYLTVYVFINIVVVIVSFCRELYVRVKSWTAGQVLYRELLSAVLFAPMSFFDTTPLGRVINRFSKDIYTIDEQLPNTIRWYIACIARITSVGLYICLVTPVFIIALIPIVYFYFISQRYYIKTSRELTRLESTSRSPIYALFSETLDGLTSIRAYKCQKRLTKKCHDLLNTNQAAYYLNFSCNCWLAVRLEFAAALIVTFTALAAVIARDYQEDTTISRENFAGLAGLALSFAISITQSINWSVRMASDLESQMVSVERVKTYSLMPQEAARTTPRDPKNVWPSRGEIQFASVSMRYRSGLPFVLKRMDLKINPGEKVGIVGRTGAGKSSILVALLRLVEVESGSIYIDDVDISTVGLRLLRSKIAVIPQDPVLFSGTVRSNLDPFSKFSDEEVWSCLHRIRLGEGVFSTLNDKINEGGSNLSVGQRQLICIGRALLSNSMIIVLDEATASVDVETDAVIQRTIRLDFSYATVLTIAHRLNTIMDSDRILVMSDGKAAEFDTPEVLLKDSGSLFSGLVKNWQESSS